jgi:hypothetical protein
VVNDWLTVAEMEKETNIPHQTIRRYIKAHGHHLILKKKHKSYSISNKSIKVILQIRNMYSDGKTSEQVDEQLANSGIPMTISIEKDHEQVNINFPDTLLEIKNNMEKLQDRLEAQDDFNRLLIDKLAEQQEQIEKQQNYILEKLAKRDEALLHSMREILEAKKLIAAAEQPKNKWWLFWTK